MPYIKEPTPQRGAPLNVIPGVWRIVSNNPGPMTYHGTCTLFQETEYGLVIIDPGPSLPEHVDAIVDFAAGRASAILITHGHYDHCECANDLADRLGVKIYGHENFSSKVATIDEKLVDGQEIFGLKALYTPGHAQDHLCYARPDRIVFTGDQVMGWSSSVVPFPKGDMADFIESLALLRDRNDDLHIPGHGPVLEKPSAFIDSLISKRMEREAAILDVIQRRASDAESIARTLYSKRGAELHGAVMHNILSHLRKLEQEGHVRAEGPQWLANA